MIEQRSIDDTWSPADDICKRCGCCSTEWVVCDECGGDGVTGHDCGEDCCPCLDPEDNVTCGTCDGDGGWDMCIGRCDDEGNHQPPLKFPGMKGTCACGYNTRNCKMGISADCPQTAS